MIQLHFVETDEQLHDCWHYVRKGLDAILNKNPGNWIPEDVYYAIRSKGSILILFEDTQHGDWVAFMVVTPVNGNDGLQMFVWCFYNEAGNPAIQDNWHQFTDWCQRMGARRIIAQSIRPGWERFGSKLGFKKAQVQYQLDL